MRRFPWVSVALLVVLGLLASLNYVDADAADATSDAYGIVGLVCVGLALVIGALGVWARAPATLPTALGIIGSGAFVAGWLADALQDGATEELLLGRVVAFTGVLIAFAASARRVAAAQADS
jgi:hypothetical protein